MSKIKYVVAVPGRPLPICIQAEGLRRFDDAVEFLDALGQVVAALPNTELVARADALADFPEDLADFVGHGVRVAPHLVPPPTVEHNRQRELMRSAPGVPGKPAPPAPPPMRSVSPAPPKSWLGSWAIGLFFGLVIGYGASLSHAGVW